MIESYAEELMRLRAEVAKLREAQKERQRYFGNEMPEAENIPPKEDEMMTPEERAEFILSCAGTREDRKSLIDAVVVDAMNAAYEECASIADLWAANVVHKAVSEGIAAAIRARKT